MNAAARFVPDGAAIEISLAYGTRVETPNDLRGIGTYTLLEREAWFEPELAFLTRALPRGSAIVDAGANIGVYTTALGRTSGPDGRVLAIEPDPRARDLLTRSAARNDGAAIAIDPRALAASRGRIGFSLGTASELSRLDSESADLIVETARLDDLLADARWPEIDFLKLDLEGGEAAAIDGARTTLATGTALVMLEIENVDAENAGATAALAALGHMFFRLAPGIDALVPTSPDTQGMNLFAAMPALAARWAARGRLVLDPPATPEPVDPDDFAGYFDRLGPAAIDPATQSKWRKARRDPGARVYFLGLADVLATRQSARSAGERMALLRRGHARLLEAAQKRPSAARLTSLLAAECALGDLGHARARIDSLLDGFGAGADGTADEPALSPLRELEKRAGIAGPARWLVGLAAAADLEFRQHSTFFAPDRARAMAKVAIDTGFADGAAARRHCLAALRLGAPLDATIVAAAMRDAPDNRNAELWRRAMTLHSGAAAG